MAMKRAPSSAHLRWPCVVGFAVCVMLVSDSLFASSTVYGRTERQMRDLWVQIMIYHHEEGEFPVTDEDSTWFEKLREFFGDHLGPIPTTPDGSLPVDEDNNPFIYELPGSDPENGDERPSLRWVGYNGIDDKGKLDDWDVRYGPNFGYYYKANYPKAILAAEIAGVL